VKSTNTIVTVILAIAVMILFYLHFSSRQDLAEVKATMEDTTPKKEFTIPKNLQGAKVLYVNIDSINNNYHAYTELSQEAAGNMQGQYASYQRKAQDLQNRYATLQDQVNMGTISTDAAAKEEAAINAGMDELKRMETNLAYLESAAMQKNDAISGEIALYFHDYALSKGIDYILMYGTGMPIIYANDSLDVTHDVVIALNEEYDARKAKAEPAPAPTGKK
jgi:outer membrane protein